MSDKMSTPLSDILYDQRMSLSHSADQHKAPREEESHKIKKTIKTISSLFLSEMIAKLEKN